MFAGMSEGSSAYILTFFYIEDEDWRIFSFPGLKTGSVIMF